MPDPLDTYFQRVNPTLMRPEEGASRFPSVDVLGSLSRLARAVYVTLPAQLDRTRVNRNRYVQRVR